MSRFGPPYTDFELDLLGPETFGPWRWHNDVPHYSNEGRVRLLDYYEAKPWTWQEEMEFYRRTANVVAVTVRR